MYLKLLHLIVLETNFKKEDWSSNDLTYKILDLIEKEGMLPPATVIEMGGQIYQDNCWDKEDSDEDTSTRDN